MTDRKARNTPLINQILLILMGALLLYLVFGFVKQVGASRQRKEDLQRLEQRIEASLEETARLERLRDYAQSEAAAEEWARKNGLSRPGEVLIVPIGEQAASPQEELQKSGNQPRVSSSRREWWTLFFGER